MALRPKASHRGGIVPPPASVASADSVFIDDVMTLTAGWLTMDDGSVVVRVSTAL